MLSSSVDFNLELSDHMKIKESLKAICSAKSENQLFSHSIQTDPKNHQINLLRPFILDHWKLFQVRNR